MTAGSPLDLCSFARKPLKDLTPNLNHGVTLPRDGALEAHFRQEEGA
jgi:hypothetical protein